MKKTIRILAYIALVIILIVIAVRIVDSARFSMAKPADAKTCNYEGFRLLQGYQSLFTRIPGGYRSSSPYDIGTFTLEKTR